MPLRVNDPEKMLAEYSARIFEPRLDDGQDFLHGDDEANEKLAILIRWLDKGYSDSRPLKVSGWWKRNLFRLAAMGLMVELEAYFDDLEEINNRF